MQKKSQLKAKPKILRNSEAVDRQSTVIRSDQSSKLKALCKDPPIVITESGPHTSIRLNSRGVEPIYTTRKVIDCAQCKKCSPTRVMYRYKSSSHGEVTLCQTCDEKVEVRSFYKLDALDRVRKKIKVADHK